MPTVRFVIGQAFPANDPVARFLTVVAMMSNDWLRLIRQMEQIDDNDPDAAGLGVMSFRQQAALHFEAATFIAQARSRFPEVTDFIRSLGQEGQEECERIAGGIDPRSDWYLGDWLADHRNVTFHYPEMHPEAAAHGAEEICNALAEAKGLVATIRTADDGSARSVRFRFADEVVVQWLPDVDTNVEAIEALRGAVLTLARFAGRAADAYLRSRPSGTIHHI